MNTFKKNALTLGIATVFAASTAVAGTTDVQAKHDGMKSPYESHSTEQVEATETKKDWSQAAKNAWAQGKIEGLFLVNQHLSAFDIDTEVQEQTVLLTGTVNNDSSKDLAEEIAMSIDGIESVENRLTVDQNQQARKDDDGSERSMSTVISDATITASVKMELIASEAKARHIDVDTERGVVTLKGKVESEVKKELAINIAKNVEDVQDVKDELKISKEMASR